MVTNYEVDAFVTSLRDEGPEVQNLITHVLQVLDDAHNPGLKPARARLRALMQRDAEIGKHRAMWAILDPWLAEPAESVTSPKATGNVIKSLGVTPP